MRRTAQAASALSLAFAAALFARLQARFWRGEYLISNNNTWRDFRVYRELSFGLWPLQGPPSSIGGHHGYLAYWIFGLWSRAFAGYHALQLLCALDFTACLALSGLIAARLASRSAAALGLGCYFCSATVLMTAYPNHIIFMPLGAAMAFYGLLRAGEGFGWVLLCAAGVTVELGCHSYGFALLAAVWVLEYAYGFGLRRHPWAWLPVGLYLIPAAAACALGRWDLAGQSLGVWKALRAMEPALNLRAMPLLRFREEVAGPWPWAEAGVVAAAWALAWRLRRDGPARAVLAFYAANFLLFLFYKYDGQYHLPMFALLPAVLAMGVDAAWRRRREAGLALTLLLCAAWARAALAKTEFIDAWSAGSGGALQSISGELAAVRVLDSLGVGEGELRRRVWFSPLSQDRRFDYLHFLYSRSLGAPWREDRCLRIERAQDPPRGRPQRSWPAGDLRVDVFAAGGRRDCDNNVIAFDGGALWYWDAEAGQFRLIPKTSRR